MNDAPNRSGSLPDPADALPLMDLLDALDPPGSATTPGEAAERDGSHRSHESYRSHESHESHATDRTYGTNETNGKPAGEPPQDPVAYGPLDADLALARALVAGRRPPPGALLGRRFAPGGEWGAGAIESVEDRWDPGWEADDQDPALTPAGPRRWRWLELAVAAVVILAGAWLFNQGPGRRPPAVLPGEENVAGGVGADPATLPAGLVPQSAEIQLRLLDQLGGPVTSQAVDAAGHLAVMRGRRLELYQLDPDDLSQPRLLGRSDIIETPILDLALAGERALLLEDEHPTVQGLIEIDLGPGFRAGEGMAEDAARGAAWAAAADEGVHLPQVRRRKVDLVWYPAPGEPYLKPVALDLLPAADGGLPHEGWVIVSSLNLADPVVKLGRLLLDGTDVRSDLPRRERTVPLLDRAEIALVDGLVDLPQGATDLALDGEGRRLYIAVRPADQAGVSRDGRVVDPEAAGGVMVKDVSDPRFPRLIEWIQRLNPGAVVREPRTGVVYDLSHSEHARRDASLPVGNLRTLLLNRLDETWEIGFSVPDGRETIAVLAHGIADDAILAITSDAEPEHPLQALSIPTKLSSGTQATTSRPRIALHDSSVLAPQLWRLRSQEADDEPDAALDILRGIALHVAGGQLGVSADPADALPRNLSLKPVEGAVAQPAFVWTAALGLPADADIVEQDGFTFVLEPGEGLAVVDRKRPAAPRITRRLPLPGATRMVGFAGGLAVLAEDPSSVADSRSEAPPEYVVVVLDLLDASGVIGPAPSLTELDRWTAPNMDPALLAADGRIGQGWRDYVIYVGERLVASRGLALQSPSSHITARHRLWATPQGRTWADRLLRDAGRRPMLGARVSTATYHLGGGLGALNGRRGQPSEILALFASRGLLYVLDARQGLVILDTVTEPYWARVAVPVIDVVGTDAGERLPGTANAAGATAATAAAPAVKDLGDGVSGPRISWSLGDGRDPALAEGYVWLTGHPQYLAPLGRQLWTEPARLRAVDGGGAAFSGELELRDLPPTVRRAGGGSWLAVRVDVREGGS